MRTISGTSGVGSSRSIGTNTSCVGTKLPSPIMNSSRVTIAKVTTNASANMIDSSRAGSPSTASAIIAASTRTASTASAIRSRAGSACGRRSSVALMRCSSRMGSDMAKPVDRRVSYVVGRPMCRL